MIQRNRVTRILECLQGFLRLALQFQFDADVQELSHVKESIDCVSAESIHI